MKCSCGNENLVVKNPPTCKKCYNKKYVRLKKKCSICGEIKEVHKNNICDGCYRSSYEQPKKICSICGKLEIIKKSAGPVCIKCYVNEKECFICKKIKEVCKRIEGKVFCRNCYNKQKRKVDKEFSIKEKLRQRLYSAFKKEKSADEYGIDYNKIVEHLKPFPDDIENYNIDHIFPLSAFDFSNPEEIVLAFSPENHQWLKKEDNFRKGAKYDKREFEKFKSKKSLDAHPKLV